MGWVLVLIALVISETARAQEAQYVRIRPQRVRPGDVVRVEVSSQAQTATAAYALLGSQRFILIPRRRSTKRKSERTRYVGYAGVPIEAEEGQLPMTVRVGTREWVKNVRIKARGWSSGELTVAKRFTSKERSPELQARIDRERKEFEALWVPQLSRGYRPRQPCSPLKRLKITSSFGTRRVFNGELQSRHYGTDYWGSVGVPVRSILPGRVVMSSNRFYTGGSIVIDHGEGLFSLYYHLSKRSVKVGDRVRCGGRIGKVGRSGRVTGPHLHLSVAVRAESLETGQPWGMYVEPEQVLKGPWLRKRRIKKTVAKTRKSKKRRSKSISKDTASGGS